MRTYIIEFQDKGGNELFSKVIHTSHIKKARQFAYQFIAESSIQDLHKAKAKRVYGK